MNAVIAKYVKPFIISTCVGIIMSVICVLTVWSNSAVSFPIMTWVYSLDVFAFFYPVFCSVPYCWLMYLERRNNFHFFVGTRIKLNKYLLFHWYSGGLFAFFSLFIISFSGALLSLCITPIYQSNRNVVAEYLFGSLLIECPLLYAFLVSAWRGIIGLIMFSFGYILSLYSKHLFVVLTGPLVYSIVENFSVTVLGVSNISLVSSFFPESVNWSYYTVSPYFSIFIGPFLLMTVCFVLIMYFNTIQKKINDEE